CNAHGLNRHPTRVLSRLLRSLVQNTPFSCQRYVVIPNLPRAPLSQSAQGLFGRLANFFLRKGSEFAEHHKLALQGSSWPSASFPPRSTVRISCSVSAARLEKRDWMRTRSVPGMRALRRPLCSTSPTISIMRTHQTNFCFHCSISF